MATNRSIITGALGTALVSMSCTLLLGSPGHAQQGVEIAPGVTMGASLRGRLEYKYDFKFDDDAPGNTDNYFLHQVRLNLLWQALPSLQFYLEGQDAGIQGDNSIDEDVTPNIFNDRFDLHQGYINYKIPTESLPLAVRLGRQKLKYGSERLVGPLEWVNTARVFDAAKLTVGTQGERSVDLFASRVVPVDPEDFNDWNETPNRYANSDFYGAYYSDQKAFSGMTVEAYYLLRHENDAEDSVHTIGTRNSAKWSNWDAELEAAFQWGDFGGLDHRALALHLDAGYMVLPNEKVRVGAAYNYGSGDDDPNDGDHETFDNLFPTNHAFYGYMDFFSLQNMHNLELTLSATPLESLDMRLAWQNFWLAEEDTDAWYNAGLGTVRTPTGANNDSYVGSEIDFTVAYPIFEKRLALLLGYSHFFTGNYISDTGSSRDADYVYMQSKISL